MKRSAESARPARLAARLAALRKRRTWVWLHRWIGLAMASFLVIAGLTGSLLAFYDELDVWVNPELHRVAIPSANAPMLDALTLRELGQAAVPEMRIESAETPYRPGRALLMYMEPRDEGGPPQDDELFVNPYTGEVLGSRRWGDLSQGVVNLMPFIYQFHYSLALGTFGIYLFGIVALLWTLDCFIGAYLTFPRGRPFAKKWSLSWNIKARRLNFDLHRASGLWTWAMLFVLAWSSVAFNLTGGVLPGHGGGTRLQRASGTARTPGRAIRARPWLARCLSTRTGTDAERNLRTWHRRSSRGCAALRPPSRRIQLLGCNQVPGPR